MGQGSPHAPTTTKTTARSATSESTSPPLDPCRHIEQEISAADGRLRATAQSFSLEWKAFLSFAMKIKASSPTGTDAGSMSIKAQRELEELLLQSQRVLSNLRELDPQHSHKWRKVYERYGYQHPSISTPDAESEPTDIEQLDLRAADVDTKLAWINSAIVAAAETALASQRFGLASSVEAAQPIAREQLQDAKSHSVLVQVRLTALANADRLSKANQATIPSNDMEELLQVAHHEQQLGLGLDRLLVRMRWLCTSHRYHLRQRVQALCQQHASRKSTGGANGQLCPLFLRSKHEIDADIAALARDCGLTVPRDKRKEIDALTFKQTADELLIEMVESSVGCKVSTGETGDTDQHESNSRPRPESVSVIPSRVGWSRWELIQAGHLGMVRNQQGADNDQFETVDADFAVEDYDGVATVEDAMLRNEWRLLEINDAAYLRARLEGLATSYAQRASVVIRTSGEETSVASSSPKARSATVASQWNAAAVADGAVYLSGNQPPSPSKGLLEPDNGLNGALVGGAESSLLYALYALRTLECRMQRRRLLRLLNYSHYLQLAVSQRYSDRSRDHPPQAPLECDWATTIDSRGEYIVSQVQRTSDGGAGHACEVIFDEARCDLAALENLMLRTASYFIRKQEDASFPASNNAGDSVVVPLIDRVQVIRDVFQCEVAFQTAKLQLAELLIGNGLLDHQVCDGRSSSNSVLLSLLQHRPVVDFTDAYFVESYAAETVQLELQVSLQQHLRDYFSSIPFPGLDAKHLPLTERHTRLVLAHRAFQSKAITTCWTRQHEVLVEADAKWFSPTCVAEYHALRQAVLEQLLVAWQLITTLELPNAPVHILERSAANVLTGNGLQLVFPSDVLVDVCRRLHTRRHTEQVTIPFTHLSQWLGAAWQLMEWHQAVAAAVYEAALLERIHRFQHEFVGELDHAGEQARLFFFDSVSSMDGSARLEPVAMSLGMAVSGSTLAGLAVSPSRGGDRSHKTVAAWIEDALWTTVSVQPQSQQSENGWQSELLRTERCWVTFLGDSVCFQDLVGAHVFEFAACLNSIAARAIGQQQRSDSLPIDVTRVRAQFAGDIALKMTDEMRECCLPYWTPLSQLKQRLRSQFTANPAAGADSHEELETVQRIERLEHPALTCVANVDAYCQLLNGIAAVPRRLVALSGRLQRLRNEARMMQTLPHELVGETTVFRETGIEDGADCADNLTEWFAAKFRQLKQDLRVGDLSNGRRKSSTCANNLDKKELDAVPPLLRTVPSFARLLHRFGACAAVASRPESDKRLYRTDVETDDVVVRLRRLEAIYALIGDTIDLCRLECALEGVGIDAPSSLSSKQSQSRRRDRGQARPPVAGDSQGLAIIARCQRTLHEHLAEWLQLLGKRAPATGGDMKMLLGVGTWVRDAERALQAMHVEHVEQMRMMLASAIIQTFADDQLRQHHQRQQQWLLDLDELLDQWLRHDVSSAAVCGGIQLFPVINGLSETQQAELRWMRIAMETTDATGIECARLLRLQRVFLLEHSAVDDSDARTAKAALARTWAELLTLERVDGTSADSVGAWNAPGAVSGESFRLKLRLLGTSNRTGDSARHAWLAVDCLTFGVGTTQPLPTADRVQALEQWLGRALELEWIRSDAKSVQRQHAAMLAYRARHDRHVGGGPNGSVAADDSPVEPASRVLIETQRALADALARGEVRASEAETLRMQLGALGREEDAKRVAFAADRTYVLQMTLRASERRAALVDAQWAERMAQMRCDVAAEYATQLHEARAEALAAAQFAETERATARTALLDHVARAQSAMVDDLVDRSGAVGVGAKAALLRAQGYSHRDAEAEAIVNENAALRGTALRLRSLVEMQRDALEQQRARESLAAARHAAGDALLRRELGQMEAHARSLEAEVVRLGASQAAAHLRLADAKREQTDEARRHREARARAVSAPLRRLADAKRDASDLEGGDEHLTHGAPASTTRPRRALPDLDEEDELFEAKHARDIRSATSPRPAIDGKDSEAVVAAARERLESSARHWQNEIRRLQQQVTRETRLRATAQRELEDARKALAVDAAGDDDERVEADAPCLTPLTMASPRRDRAQSAAPCTPLRPHSSLAVKPKRPSTSYSPRTSSLVQRINNAQMPTTPTTPTTNRRFHVAQRETATRVGGVAGVPHALVVRPPLPYR